MPETEAVTFRSGKSVDVASLLTVAGVCAGVIFAAQKFLRQSERERYNLRGKTVLITGGSRGFGLALAEEFGAAGSRLALCARDGGELDKACAALKAKGIEAHAFASDITQASEADEVVRRVIQHFGQIDVLINDAGRISVGSLDTFTKADFEEAMDLMFWAPLNLTYAVLPHMRQRHSGRIVNITSVGGRVSIPHLLPYSCAKFAFVGFSTGLGTELSGTGVEVLTVVPGLMRTGSYLNAEFKGNQKQEFAWFGLLGNLPGFSVAARYAAELVRDDLERGESVCTISFPAKVLVALEALAPNLNREVLQLLNKYVLPAASNRQDETGKAINPSLNRVFQGLTALGRIAATRLNET